MASLSGAGSCTTRPRGCATCLRARSRHRLRRLRPDRREPPRRPHAPDPRAGALRSDVGHSPIAARRRRHRTDRRSELQGCRAGAADARTGRSQRRRDSRRSLRGSSISTTPTAQARLVNNAEWLMKLGAIEFMRDVGKHFTVNAMMAKESVKRRVEGSEGISYTEFSYPLLQAYDFLVLHDRSYVHAAGRRQRSVGKHHGRHGSDPARAGWQGARPGIAAADDRRGNEVRQDRGGQRLARPRADVALRVLPVLAQRRTTAMP